MANKKATQEEKSSQIIGAAYAEVKRKVMAFAESSYPILLYGETGTGKEEFAKLYMESSPRSGKKETTNCAAYSGELLRSELFGHEQGAFTGAVRKRKGLIRTCEKGIVFLDELGSASHEFQAAILRVVEENKVRPVGSDEEVDADTLIIAATNSLSKIRKDLQHRFHLIHIPPLQKADIPALAKHFAGGKAIKKEILDGLMDRSYPGNVRELKKKVEKVHVEKGGEIYTRKREVEISPVSMFDYDRYCRELDIWNARVQPILDKYGYDHIRYAYQPWDDNWIDENSPDFDFEKFKAIQVLTVISTDHTFHDWTLHRYETRTLFWIVEHGGILQFQSYDGGFEETDPELSATRVEYWAMALRDHIRDYLDTGTLPYLLKFLDRNSSGDASEPIDKPTLAPLLDMTLNKALLHFEAIYWQNLNNTCESKDQLAQKSGETKKNVDQRKRRNKKNLYDIQA